MKIDFTQNILEKLLSRRKKRLEEDKIIKKKKDKLSIIEVNNYDQIIKRNETYWGGFYFTWVVMKIMFFITLFVIASIYFYGNGIVNIKELFEPVFAIFLKLIGFAILLDVIFILISPFFNLIEEKRIDRGLFLNK